MDMEMRDLYYTEKDQNKISIRSYKVLLTILEENPKLNEILKQSKSVKEVHSKIEEWVCEVIGTESNAYKFFSNENNGREALRNLSWQEVGAIRILDYIKNAGRKVEDANLKNRTTRIQPLRILWLAAKKGIGGAKYDFFMDMLFLFRQFNGSQEYKIPNKDQVLEWMDRHHSGNEEFVRKIRIKNKRRIIKVIVKKLDSRDWKSPKYKFKNNLTDKEKIQQVEKWWDDWQFHIKFAIRDPETMNEMLDGTISPDMIKLLYKAQEVGIPFFVNPYYLSLLNVREYEIGPGADQVIRDYMFYSEELINEFGKIVAWEKEDIVKPGKPNAAGWILPSQHNIHRRYPEVAILIPDTMGRACGGLCVSCQRMYDFQSGHLNFNVENLKPDESWDNRLAELMDYYGNDSQLRDILITGGDAFMSSDKSLRKILDAVYNMALGKIEKNKHLPDGKKLAEMLRIRLGTRLPVYLPHRITNDLVKVLADFKSKASKIGFKQFVIQTHFVTSMEVTPEAIEGIRKLTSAGWMVTNQMVYTTAASVRGHAAKLRKVLNDFGVVSYYTFSVKGFKENSHNFTVNARAVQESVEEKAIGTIPQKLLSEIKNLPLDAENIGGKINELRIEGGVPFLATDRNVMNIPGVGKSLTFRVIGITRFGHRILEFEHDVHRNHSPIIEKMQNFVVVESKTVRQYLKQIERIGEEITEYELVNGYSIGETEPRMPIYEYPEYDFEITKEFTNLKV